MSKYIDADIILDDLQDGRCESDILLAVRQAIVNEITGLLSIDIVQCKDCRYCQAGQIYVQNTDGTQFIVNECHYYKPPKAVELDHYCGYGKEK